MATLQIKQVPEELHAELRRRAEGSRQSLRDYVLNVLEREVERPSIVDWLRDVRANEAVVAGPSSAELVRAARDEG
jgi:plasmid stability protein